MTTCSFEILRVKVFGELNESRDGDVKESQIYLISHTIMLEKLLHNFNFFYFICCLPLFLSSLTLCILWRCTDIYPREVGGGGGGGGTSD